MPRGTHIGVYRILRLINQGGQGSVYLGFDDRLHRRVAIKIYRLPQDKARRRSVLHEAQLVAKIQSPKVVQIYDLVVANDHVALIMEYVAGCDLEEFLEGCLPSLPSILTICIDIAGALAVARQQKIVHGDLKASNILITAQGRAKLTDFGIARGQGALTNRAVAAASLSCMSPEQYMGDPLDVRSDLFALGCLLYRMLTGKQAFIKANELDIHALLEKDPPPVLGLVRDSLYLPPELVSLLDSMLQKSPQNRPGNTHQVRTILREISRGVPISVGNTLLNESQPYFRLESPADIPPVIPSDLTRNGRSRLGRKGVFALFSTKKSMSLWISGAVAFTCVMGVILVWSAFSSVTRVVIEQPVFAIETEAELPKELSGSWVREVIATALHEHHGSIEVVDSSPPGTLYSPALAVDRKKSPEFARLFPRVQCIGDACLLALAYEIEGQRYFQQKMIFANMPISHWSDTLASETRALFDQYN